MEISFTDPNNLYFLLGVPVLILAYVYNIKYKKKSALIFSNFEAISRVFKPGRRFASNTFAFFISLAIFVSLILAASGATLWYFGQSNDVDYVLAIDSSVSMTADDFEPNRLGAAKVAAESFVDQLSSDAKVAVLSFSGTSFIEHELTGDFGAIKESIKQIEVKDIAGTDVSNAMITSSNLMLLSDRPKAIILLTDGRSTVGVPVDYALEYMKEAKIVVHTIGVGTEEGGTFAGEDIKSTLDSESLTSIAEETEGAYYAVRNLDEIKDAYTEILSGKKEYIKIRLGPLLISVILVLLIFQWLLAFTKYNSLP